MVLTDSLKNSVINLFEVTYKNEAEIISLLRSGESYDHIWSHNFIISRSGTVPQTNLRILYVPKSYEALIQNTNVLYALHNINFTRNWLYLSQVDCLSESQRVLQLIKDELDK